MIIKYKLALEDYLNYNIYLYKTRKALKRQKFTNRITTSFIIYGIYIVLNSLLKFNQDGFSFYELIIPGLWFIFYDIYFRIRQKNRLKKQFKASGLNMFEEKTLRIEEESISEIYSDREKLVEKDKIDSVEETAKYFYINLIGDSLYIIPKSCIEDEDKFRRIYQGWLQ